MAAKIDLQGAHKNNRYNDDNNNGDIFSMLIVVVAKTDRGAAVVPPLPVTNAGSMRMCLGARARVCVCRFRYTVCV